MGQFSMEISRPKGSVLGGNQQAGSASAVVGAVQYGSGMLGSAAVGLLADGTPAPMVLVMAIGGIGASLISLDGASKKGRLDGR
jgi:DHA1 family bicyclomycin/chloramphenicol resistance-like MFS transporter